MKNRAGKGLIHLWKWEKNHSDVLENIKRSTQGLVKIISTRGFLFVCCSGLLTRL